MVIYKYEMKDMSNRSNTVRNVTGYLLESRGSGVRFFVGTCGLPLQTGSGVHPVSCLISTRDFSPYIKRPGREADCLSSFSGKARAVPSLLTRLHALVLNYE
jgi:hypothetical protein